MENSHFHSSLIHIPNAFRAEKRKWKKTYEPLPQLNKPNDDYIKLPSTLFIHRLMSLCIKMNGRTTTTRIEWSVFLCVGRIGVVCLVSFAFIPNKIKIYSHEIEKIN